MFLFNSHNEEVNSFNRHMIGI
ncbi:hypothetical protein PSP6_250128 [Paraburkholderia tropica]|nr:hypothetical protein PSP6_250128 [Paraburkholderia tropica]